MWKGFTLSPPDYKHLFYNDEMKKVTKKNMTRKCVVFGSVGQANWGYGWDIWMSKEMADESRLFRTDG